MESTDIIFEFKEKIEKVQGDHYLKYFFADPHFPFHPLLFSMCTSIGNVNDSYPGYAEEMIRRMVALQGKGELVLENIISVFSEILIANYAVEVADMVSGKKYFINEPGSKEGKKNPEFRSRFNGVYYCVEVKKPNLITHMKNRIKPLHLPARSALPITDKENTTFPRDNPLKDFLNSAQSKFEAYITEYPDDYRLLFIMWDNHMYEPISSLLHPFQGLLTEGSFNRDIKNEAISYPLIDGIVIVSHLHNFNNALLEKPLNVEIGHAFQYKKTHPLHAFIQNPSGRKVPREIIEIFDCMTEDHFHLFSDYSITDFVNWSYF